MKISFLLGAAAIATVALIASKTQATQGGEFNTPPTIPANPAVELPVQLVSAQAFTLQNAERHTWRAEQPEFKSGLLLALEADAAYLAPRQLAEPVLYVGNQTAQRVNTGYPSGQLIVVVPNMTLEELASAPIFFGQPMLPENVTAAIANVELRNAVESGLTGSPNFTQVTESQVVEALDLEDLFFQASFLIEEHAPDERDLIDGLRVKRYEFK